MLDDSDTTKCSMLLVEPLRVPVVVGECADWLLFLRRWRLLMDLAGASACCCASSGWMWQLLPLRRVSRVCLLGFHEAMQL